MTTELRFQLFQAQEDFHNWEKYFSYIRQNPEFNEKTKSDLLKIYYFLKKELGKDYIARCHADGRNWVNHWITSRGYYYSKMQWLYESLNFFKQHNCRYEQLLGRIRSNAECNNQGIPFLLIGDSLRKAGLNVVFEPKTDFESNPDIQISSPLTQELIYCEISRIYNSEPRMNISRTYYSIMDCFTMQPPLTLFTGKIHRPISEAELTTLSNIILDAKRKVLENKCFLVFGLEKTSGILEFGCAHPEKVEEISEWKRVKKFPGLNQIQSLPLDFDDTDRVENKIRKEAKQLPKEFPGLIYLPLEPTYFLWGVKDYEEMIEQIRRLIGEYNQILGVCMYSHIGNEAEEFSFLDNGDFIERKIIHDSLQQDVLFIFNHKCQLKVETDTLERIYKSFSNIFQ